MRLFFSLKTQRIVWGWIVTSNTCWQYGPPCGKNPENVEYLVCTTRKGQFQSLTTQRITTKTTVNLFYCKMCAFFKFTPNLISKFLIFSASFSTDFEGIKTTGFITWFFFFFCCFFGWKRMKIPQFGYVKKWKIKTLLVATMWASESFSSRMFSSVKSPSHPPEKKQSLVCCQISFCFRVIIESWRHNFLK